MRYIEIQNENHKLKKEFYNLMFFIAINTF